MRRKAYEAKGERLKAKGIGVEMQILSFSPWSLYTMA